MSPAIRIYLPEPPTVRHAQGHVILEADAIGASMTLTRTTARNQRPALLAALAISLLLGAAGCGKAPSPPAGEAHVAAPGDFERGPHRGRLLSDGEFRAEVTIYERGVPPQFRVYFYEGSKPLPPGDVTLTIDLARLGGRMDHFEFAPEGDYLVGSGVVEEPHSFDVAVVAQYKGSQHSWKYSSFEGRVQLSDEAVRTSAIQIETAGPAKLRSILDLPGEIALNGDRATHVVPRTPGVIQEIRKSQGDPVRRGEVIAVIESRELAEAKQAEWVRLRARPTLSLDAGQVMVVRMPQRPDEEPQQLATFRSTEEASAFISANYHEASPP